MAQYLSPFPGSKKTRILERRVQELRHAVNSSAPSERIEAAAERVRSAILNLIKAKEAAVRSFTSQQKRTRAAEKLDEIRSIWRNHSATDIVHIYCED